MTVDKPLNQKQLMAEMTAAGALPPNFANLLQRGNELLNQLLSGAETELNAQQQAIVTAHIAQPTEDEKDRADLVDQFQAMVTRLDAIIAEWPAYTNAQKFDAVVDLARISRRILKVVWRGAGGQG